MATKVRGITIELGADTSGINKALSNVNKEIGSTQKQLKDVERLLKLDPGNTELLEQKQRLLGDAVGQTKTKLDALKEAQKKVAEEIEKTGEGQEQYDALQREIISCENELQNLEKRAAESNATIAKIGTVADGLSSKFSNLANKTKGISTAAGGALAGLGGLAVKAAQNADDLNTLAKQTGLTTEELQKMQYASELIDVPVDTITGSLKKLKKNMTSTSKDTQKAWQDLGVTLKDDVTGEFRNIDDVFYDTVAALSNIDNETERDIVAMQLFGKSADELAGIIDDGGEALKRLGEEAKNKGVIISQEDLDSASELDDALEQLKAEATGTFAQLGTEVAQMLLPYIPQIREALQRVLDVIKDLDPDKLAFAAKILAVIAVLSPLLSALSTLFGIISTLAPAFSVLASVIGAIGAPITIAVAAIALLATKGDWLQEKLQDLDDFLQNIFAKDFTEVFGPVLGGIINKFMQTFKTQWDAFKKILDGVIDIVRGVFTGDWERAWNGVKEIFSGIFDSFVGIAKVPLNGIISLLNGLINKVNSFIEKINSISITNPFSGEKVGVNIPTIPTIPMLAKGGTVLDGSAIVGEAGAEMINVNHGAATVTPLTNSGGAGGSDISGLLEKYLPYLANDKGVYLDGKTLVGGIVNEVNNQLGAISARGAVR